MKSFTYSLFFHLRLILACLFAPASPRAYPEPSPQGTVYGDLATSINANQKVSSQIYDGRIKYLCETYTQGAADGSVGDVIQLSKLPDGARVIGHLSTVTFGTGNTNATLAVGKTGAATALKTATAIATAGTFACIDPASGAADVILGADEYIIATNATAAIKAEQAICFRIAYVALQ